MLKAYFSKIFDDEQILENEPLSRHTTFKIGGMCALMLFPCSPEEFKAAIEICRAEKLKFFVIGSGSNLLAMDGGYGGAAIKPAKNMREIRLLSENKIYAEAGVTLSSLANFCLKNGLSGLEFASGIPGTLGGALYMNAGAYGEEMAGVAERVLLLDEQGGVYWVEGADCAFDYRTSRMQRENMFVLAAELLLKKGRQEEIRAKMTRLNTQRAEKQPLEFPSAGSTFKRPKGCFAGKLIQDSGLAGFKIGGAQVSEKHCGFIVNRGGATAEDVLNLISHIQAVVKENYGVELQPEMKILE